MRLSLCLLVVGLLLSGSTASAAPILYTFTGIGSGTLDGNAFGADDFVITVTGDTAAIVPLPGNNGFQNPGITATITHDIFGTATFLISTRVFVNNANDVVGFSRGIPDGGSDLIDLNCDISCVAYDLASSFGPVFDATPFAINQFSNVSTSLGLLTFDAVRNATFQASVPEPMGLTLLGMAAYGVARRFRKQARL